MARFDDGIKYYDTGQVTINVNFPEGDRKCRWCPMCKSDNGIRHRCILTDRILYTTEMIPPECPLTFKEEEHEGNAPSDR